MAFSPYEASWGSRFTRWPTGAVKEFDDTVFKLPKEKRAAWLVEHKADVIAKLNKDFAKPWFGWKKDGHVASDLGDMT